MKRKEKIAAFISIEFGLVILCTLPLFFAARRTRKPADAPYIDHIHVPASSHNSDCKANGT